MFMSVLEDYVTITVSDILHRAVIRTIKKIRSGCLLPIPEGADTNDSFECCWMKGSIKLLGLFCSGYTDGQVVVSL